MTRTAINHDKQGYAPKANRERLSLREEQKHLTRERLIDAAFEVFKEVGFRAGTIDKIMKRAGANRATFYLHFRDKLDVAAALGWRSGSETAKLFHRLDNFVNPTVDDVRAWVEDRQAYFTGDVLLMNYVVNEAITSEPKFAEEYGAYLSRLADIVMAKTLSRWSGRQRDIVRSKFILLVMMEDRFVLHNLYQGLSFPGKAATDAMAQMLWDALFAETPEKAIAAVAAISAKPRAGVAPPANKPRRQRTVEVDA